MKYDLVTEPWIPCLKRDGTVVCLSLRETLTRAHELREIFDPSPLVTVALHRMLLALLHAAYNGPATESAWCDIWRRPTLDIERIGGYLAKRAGRFDLFNAQWPFYQTSGIVEAYARSPAGLLHELANGNNTTLFDHTVESVPFTLTPDRAARQLVALQAFAVGGLVSFDDKAHKSANAAPLAKGAVAVVKGGTLRETLMLNMVLYDPENERPFRSTEHEMPAWDRMEPTQPQDRVPDGYVDWLTWQSRRVRLFPILSDTGVPVVATVAIMKGYQLPAGKSRHEYESMIAFTEAKKVAAGQDPWPAVGFREDRALWRDSLPLFNQFEAGSKAPGVLRNVANLLEPDASFPLELYGLATDKASVLLWRHERLTVPLRYLRDDLLFGVLKDAMATATTGHRALRAGVEQLATLLLAPEADDRNKRQADPKARSQFVEGLGADRLYWSQLELRFRQLIEALPRDCDEVAPGVFIYGKDCVPEWRTYVKSTAERALSEVVNGLGGSARALKSAAVAWPVFYSELKKGPTA